jgi:Predicted membrane protein
MIIHGGLMEIGGCLALIPVLLMGTDKLDMSRYFSFIVPFFQENLHMMMVMGGIYGIIRVIGAVGLWKNRKWGLSLSVINCVVTMILMMFMLPAGVMDGVLACSALILILTQYYGDKKIME